MTDIPRITSLQEFNIAVADAMKEFDISAATAKRFLVMTTGLMVIYDEPTAEAEFIALLLQAAADKEPWAVEWLCKEMAKTIEPWKPAYHRALELGADPVMALRVAHGLDENTAREAVALLNADTK